MIQTAKALVILVLFAATKTSFAKTTEPKKISYLDQLAVATLSHLANSTTSKEKKEAFVRKIKTIQSTKTIEDESDWSKLFSADFSIMPNTLSKKGHKVWTHLNQHSKSSRLDHLSIEINKLPSHEQLVFETAIAALYLEKENYPEALRVVYKLSKARSEYTVIYAAIQKIFSKRQRGDGKVSLKSL